MTIVPFVRVRFRLCGRDKCAGLWLLTNPKFIADRLFDKFNLSPENSAEPTRRSSREQTILTSLS